MSKVRGSAFPSDFSKQLPAAFWAGVGYPPLTFAIYLLGWPKPYWLASALPLATALIIIFIAYRQHSFFGKDQTLVVRMILALIVVIAGGGFASGLVIYMLSYTMIFLGGF